MDLSDEECANLMGALQCMIETNMRFFAKV